MFAIDTTSQVTETPKSVTFRWTYIILPVLILLIAVILAAVFYGRLPVETAYRFSNGVPVNWVSRGSLMAWALGLQLIFVLISSGITFMITGATRRMQLPETPLNRRLFAIIGNVVALPQIIIAYAMLDIFLYNIFSKNLPALWAFALVVMLAGGAILAVLFTGAFSQYRRLKAENLSGSKTDAK